MTTDDPGLSFRPQRTPKRRVVRTANGGKKVLWRARYGIDHETGRELFATPESNGGSATFKRRDEAIRAMDEAITAARERATRPVQSSSTVEGYFEGWLAKYPRSERSEATLTSRIGCVLPFELEGVPLGDWDLRDLKRRHAGELVAQLFARGRTPTGIRNVLHALSALAEDSITDELCELNPWRGAKVRDDDRRALTQKREVRVWSFEEMHEFASFAGAYEPMIRLLADTGVRIGELFAMRRLGLHVAEGIVEVRGSAWRRQVIGSSPSKNHDRDVPVPAGCVALLRSMPVQLHSEWLFPDSDGGLWTESAFSWNVWAPTIERANEDREGRRLDPRPHEFRHSYVTHLRAAGVDPADLADITGHSEATATHRYTHALRQSGERIRGVIG